MCWKAAFAKPEIEFDFTAQLIDGISGNHVWADRYDRELTDIFEIQDEISKSIVGALKLKLLPNESSAIADRGTSNVDAYNLYLMARQQWIGGTFSAGRSQAIVRTCRQATLLDPDYAQAWALMALAQSNCDLGTGSTRTRLPRQSARCRSSQICPSPTASERIIWRTAASLKRRAERLRLR